MQSNGNQQLLRNPNVTRGAKVRMPARISHTHPAHMIVSHRFFCEHQLLK
jgi:hypothetical protein